MPNQQLKLCHGKTVNPVNKCHMQRNNVTRGQNSNFLNYLEKKHAYDHNRGFYANVFVL